MTTFSIPIFKYSVPAFKFVLIFMALLLSGPVEAVSVPIIDTPRKHRSQIAWNLLRSIEMIEDTGEAPRPSEVSLAPIQSDSAMREVDRQRPRGRKGGPQDQDRAEV